MKNYQTQRVMLYFQINQLLREHFTISQISEKLSISRTTVYFYADMSEEAFLEWVKGMRKKSKKLSPYEDQIKSRLSQHPELSGYQIHDWMLEHHPQLKVSRRTVSNFVCYLRQVYQLAKPAKEKQGREYTAVEDQAYGRQAQVDFGVYEMPTSQGSSHKVYFMITVLSRSRYKHVYFLDRPFTTADVVKAHESAFTHFGGIPQQMVYDQDKLMVVSENGGDILFTEKFRAYLKVRKFETFVCRGSDPETKGKSESVVKYVKTNFLNQRQFINAEILNAECIAWLERTGNGQLHGTTRRIPTQDFLIEQASLQALDPANLSFLEYTVYHVRKDNLITWKSNRYSVPAGTYKGKGTKVWVKVEGKNLVICQQDKTPIAQHEISLDKGQTITNSNHKRDRSQTIKLLIEQVAQLFTDQSSAQAYFAQLQQAKPRYIRDQLLLIKKAIGKSNAEYADQALKFCQTNTILNANDFSAVLDQLSRTDHPAQVEVEQLLMEDVDRKHYLATPQKSSITDYESILNPNNLSV
ncbi:MAG: IS21 family transposase [Saprospiraceae bacterium]